MKNLLFLIFILNLIVIFLFFSSILNYIENLENNLKRTLSFSLFLQQNKKKK